MKGETTLLNTISPETIIPLGDYPNYKTGGKSEIKSNLI
jgi:hypothetical protein